MKPNKSFGDVEVDDISNSRTVTVDGEPVTISHRFVASTLPVEDVEASSAIEFEEGDVYLQLE